MANLSAKSIESYIEHPAILSIAIDLIINPKRRDDYAPLALLLADHAIIMLKDRLSRL